MPTLYLDVYFLINFTVDAVALFLSARLCRLPVTRLRIFLSAAIGAGSACVFLFLPKSGIAGAASAGLILLSFLAMACICAHGERFSRIFRYGIVFLLLETAIGGAVYLFYGFLDRRVAPLLPPEENGYRRKLLLSAVLLFLGMSLVKVLLSVFGREKEKKSASVDLTLFEKSIRFSALVDSGNLAEDPMDRRPVLFVKADVAVPVLPPGFSQNSVTDLPEPWKTRLRLIPFETPAGRSLTLGFVPDSVTVIVEEQRRGGKVKRQRKSICVIMAVDTSGGDYDGFSGLLPSSVLN